MWDWGLSHHRRLLDGLDCLTVFARSVPETEVQNYILFPVIISPVPITMLEILQVSNRYLMTGWMNEWNSILAPFRLYSQADGFASTSPPKHFLFFLLVLSWIWNFMRTLLWVLLFTVGETQFGIDLHMSLPIHCYFSYFLRSSGSAQHCYSVLEEPPQRRTAKAGQRMADSSHLPFHLKGWLEYHAHCFLTPTPHFPQIRTAQNY